MSDFVYLVQPVERLPRLLPVLLFPHLFQPSQNLLALDLLKVAALTLLEKPVPDLISLLSLQRFQQASVTKGQIFLRLLRN